jgi:AhpD family alkylhydroperoxidase
MIRYIKADSARTARGLVAEVYGQMRKEFGLLGEPITLHSPVPDLLAGVWSSFRESLLAGEVPRPMKEAVAVAVSRLNRCPYCVDAHTVFLRATACHDAARAIQNDLEDGISDPGIRALVKWARATRSPGSSELARPPFSRLEAPEIVGTAVWIHYINRMSKIFIGKNLIPIASNPLGLRSLSERMGGLFFASVARKRVEPGESLRLLRPAQRCPDFDWAAASAPISDAFGSFALAADEAGAAALSSEVRARVSEQVGAWDGTDPGSNHGWMTSFLHGLNPRDSAGARLALLAGIAPDRVDENCIRAFRNEIPADGALLGAVAWSSLAAARRISSWISC